jgi:hypothetical protein
MTVHRTIIMNRTSAATAANSTTIIISLASPADMISSSQERRCGSKGEREDTKN